MDASVVPDLRQPVQLAERVWWVGAMLPGDRFQCHTYLIEQGDQSVLIDPGSALTAHDVVRKVDAIVGLDHVRWMICSHADPDILGAIPALVRHGLHTDVSIVTHWRDAALIRHAGWNLPYWAIEDHGWRLELENRALRFVFTPYSHFAGAFCTFDPTSGTLFTSDLFGAFTDGERLFADPEETFEGMRSFHQHYMPSSEALTHALEQVERLPVRLIAPQHGRVIGEALLQPAIDSLKTLDCGLYLLAEEDPGLRFLLTASRALHQVTEAVIGETSFAAIARQLGKLATELLNARGIEFWSVTPDAALCFDDSDGYEGRKAVPAPRILAALGEGEVITSPDELLVPLRPPGTQAITGLAVIGLNSPVDLDLRSRHLLEQVAAQVGVAVEREVVMRLTELDREALFTQATHDPLTGLYNRRYLDEVATKVCARDDREHTPHVAALMVDIDHFKRVNDSFGHAVGDEVLRGVAKTIETAVRVGDTAVRFGGEEFCVLLEGVDAGEAQLIAERICALVPTGFQHEPSVTVSVGVAMHHRNEDHHALIGRADAALYRAKESGRDRVEADLAA